MAAQGYSAEVDPDAAAAAYARARTTLDAMGLDTGSQDAFDDVVAEMMERYTDGQLPADADVYAVASEKFIDQQRRHSSYVDREDNVLYGLGEEEWIEAMDADSMTDLADRC